MTPRSFLFYGGPGAGKTALATSSFWDFRKREPVPGRTGRLLLIGREDNTALGIPEEMVRRFPILAGNEPLKFATDFAEYCRSLTRAARQGGGPTDIVVDGWSEFCYNYLYAYEAENESADQWAGYREWKSYFLARVQDLNPATLKANIFGTARIGEFRKPGKSRKGTEVKGDQDWLADFKYFPAMEGWTKYNLGHYFNFVVYMDYDAKPEIKGGKVSSRAHWLSDWRGASGYWTKNIYAHAWPAQKDRLTDAVFADVEAIIEGIEGGAPRELSAAQN